eukprot:3812521-Prymnesium_polylepis.1
MQFSHAVAARSTWSALSWTSPRSPRSRTVSASTFIAPSRSPSRLTRVAQVPLVAADRWHNFGLMKVGRATVNPRRCQILGFRTGFYPP